MKYLLIFLIFLMMVGSAFALNELEQFSITWTFDENIAEDLSEYYQYGTFANDDYWITNLDSPGGDVTIIGIDPDSTLVGGDVVDNDGTDYTCYTSHTADADSEPGTGVDWEDYWVVKGTTATSWDIGHGTYDAGRIQHGSMINPPQTDSTQGYDNDMYVNIYSATLNVALDVAGGNPLVISPLSSLVSSITHDEGGLDEAQLKTAAVLTILASAPDPNSFRPPYCGTDKSVKFTTVDLDYTKLKSLTALNSVLTLHTDTPSDITDQTETVERMFERPWIDNHSEHYSRVLHPSENMISYGYSMAEQVGNAALMLNLDFTENEKKTLLIRYVQLGIDNYGVIVDGEPDIYKSNGGHGHGRKLPILVAAIVLNDSDMLDMFAKTGDYVDDGEYSAGNRPPDMVLFSEDDKTFYVTASDVYTSPYDLNVLGPAQDTGTVTVTNGSPIITGNGTGWSDTGKQAYFVVVGGESQIAGVQNEAGYYAYEIDSWNPNGIEITLKVNYAEITASGVSYSTAALLWFGHGHSGNRRDYHEYTNEHLGMPEAGYSHVQEPVRDGLDWDGNYRTAEFDGGCILTVLIMGQKVLWNHDAAFDYQDRWVEIEKVENPGSFLRTEFIRDMWDEYRIDYGEVWTAYVTNGIRGIRGRYTDGYRTNYRSRYN